MSDNVTIASVWAGFDEPDESFCGTCVPVSGELALTDKHVIGICAPDVKLHIRIENREEFIEVYPLRPSEDFDVIALKITTGFFPIEYFPELLSFQCDDYLSHLKNARFSTKGFPDHFSPQEKGIRVSRWEGFSLLTNPKESGDAPFEFQFSGHNYRGCSGSPLLVQSQDGKRYLAGLFTHGGEGRKRSATSTTLAIDPVIGYLHSVAADSRAHFSPVSVDKLTLVRINEEENENSYKNRNDVANGTISNVDSIVAKNITIRNYYYNNGEKHGTTERQSNNQFTVIGLAIIVVIMLTFFAFFKSEHDTKPIDDGTDTTNILSPIPGEVVSNIIISTIAGSDSSGTSILGAPWSPPWSFFSDDSNFNIEESPYWYAYNDYETSQNPRDTTDSSSVKNSPQETTDTSFIIKRDTVRLRRSGTVKKQKPVGFPVSHQNEVKRDIVFKLYVPTRYHVDNGVISVNGDSIGIYYGYSKDVQYKAKTDAHTSITIRKGARCIRSDTTVSCDTLVILSWKECN